MFRNCLVAALLVAVLIGTANAETGKKPDPQAVTRGKVLYEKYCQSYNFV